VLHALQQVALSYISRDVQQSIPLWRMALTPLSELRRRAGALGVGEVVDCASVMGGGTLPGVTIPSVGVAIEGDRTPHLRASTPPIVARVTGGQTVCDLRTVLDVQDDALADSLKQ
jgi:L-seryl-tRNA(Ser) seleniumtransferase